MRIDPALGRENIEKRLKNHTLRGIIIWSSFGWLLGGGTLVEGLKDAPDTVKKGAAADAESTTPGLSSVVHRLRWMPSSTLRRLSW